MYIRLCETFIDRHFGDDYRITKTYNRGSIEAITIHPSSGGRIVYIYDKEYIKTKPKDSNLLVCFEMDTIENAIETDGGAKDIILTIKSFLQDEMIKCICADSGENCTLERIRDNDINTLQGVLCDYGFSEKDDFSLAELMIDSLFVGNKIRIGGVEFSILEISKSFYEGVDVQ